MNNTTPPVDPLSPEGIEAAIKDMQRQSHRTDFHRPTQRRHSRNYIQTPADKAKVKDKKKRQMAKRSRRRNRK